MAHAVGLYLQYKCFSLTTKCSQMLFRWDEDKLAEAWTAQNNRGGREVKRLAETFEGYYLKSAQVRG